MTKRLHQLLSCYLALCFAFAGAIAFSPVLHQIVEHAGIGSLHTHFGIAGDEAVILEFHRRGGNHFHTHLVCLKKHDPTENASVPSAPDNSPNHEHQSLPQLLASGLVEQAFDFPILQKSFVPIVVQLERHDEHFSGRDWDAQTAPRGPPSNLWS